MKFKDFVATVEIQEAVSKVKGLGEEAFLLAGGTSSSFIEGESEKIAIDIRKLPLRFIKKDGKKFKIGALSTLDDIMKFEEKGWVLNRVAVRTATQQIRNISTIGGNTAKPFYWNDFPVALLVLDGEISIIGENSVKVTAEEFFKQPTKKLKDAKGFIESIYVKSLDNNSGFSFHKEVRTFPAFTSFTCASSIEVEKGMIKNVCLAISATVAYPQRLKEIETQLVGKKAEISVIDNLSFDVIDRMMVIPKEGMSELYCKNLMKVRIKDSLTCALEETISGRGV